MDFNYKEQVHNIEKEMQKLWTGQDGIDPEITKPPYYCLDMFPYPSGIGLHVGHPLGYIGLDVHARYMRMRGAEVLHPIGFDSFGLPAEQFAIQTGQHPHKTTNENIKNMKSQLKSLAISYDWNREISTCEPEYYKWTQWIFAQIYNSFFDHTEVWNDGFGHKLIGRAKSIEVLRQYLQSNKWHIDLNGKPVPGSAKNPKKYSEDEIESALDVARLAYRDYAEVNWCPRLGTVLSNEEVTKDGRSERGNFPVEKRKMRQWMMRITQYSQRLTEGLQYLDWPPQTIAMQRNWIGLSKGVEITFNGNPSITVFTTRPDTLLGVTFIAVSKDHPAYGAQILRDPNSAAQLNNADTNKVGIFTGSYVIHPITHTKIPVWIANYVLNDYGSGAVMGVPAHDQRDFEFAKQYGIEIVSSIMPNNEWLVENNTSTGNELENLWITNPGSFEQAFTGEGPLIEVRNPNKPEDVLEFSQNESIEECIQWLDKHEIGKAVHHHKLRDWLFSRQRYWGEPFPIVYDSNDKAYLLDDTELPLELPKDVDFTPPIGSMNPVAPLARCADWIEVEGNIVDGRVITQNIDKAKAKKFTRESNTMPNWAGSCWYYLRYISPHCQNGIIDKSARDYWCRNKYATVDLYVGGAEHAVLHCLYARFWHMILFDLGYVPNPEPFKRLIHQGLITADAYVDSNGLYVDKNIVTVKQVDHKKIAHNPHTNEELTIVQGKMGKSYKNGITPEEVCARYGIDVFRLYLMYMAPLTQSREWNDESIIGMERFCKKVCNMISHALKAAQDKSSDKVNVKLHSTIKVLTAYYDRLEFNTAIAAMIELCNLVDGDISVADCVIFVQLLAPYTPHLAEYWYQEIGKKYGNLRTTNSILQKKWPRYDEKLLASQKVKIPVTVNQKFKFTLEENPDISDEMLEKLVIEKLKLTERYEIMIIRKEVPVIVNVLKS